MRHLVAGSAALLLLTGGMVAAVPSYAAPETCQGLPVTIAAAADRQTVQGTDVADVISAAGYLGVTIYGNGGDDVICTGGPAGAVMHGGSGDDSIVGPGILHGDEGDDTLTLVTSQWTPPAPGSIAAGTLDGGPGDDVLDASAAPTPDYGGGPYQVLIPGPGDDTVMGTQTAQLSFDGAQGVTISVPAGTVDGQGHDTISGISDFIGSLGHDTFRGSSEAERWLGSTWPGGRGEPDDVRGSGGDDHLQGAGRLFGGEGADVIRLIGRDGIADGGPGDDDLLDTSNDGGLAVRSGTLRGGDGDDLIGVMRMTKPRDSRFRFVGGAGDDRIHVAFYRSRTPCRSRSCHDLIDGGAGRDRVMFGHSSVRINLTTGRAAYGAGSRATVRGIEDVNGAWGDDVLIGDDGPNVLRGRRGNDVIIGRGGHDLAQGAMGRDTCRAEVMLGCQR